VAPKVTIALALGTEREEVNAALWANWEVVANVGDVLAVLVEKTLALGTV